MTSRIVKSGEAKTAYIDGKFVKLPVIEVRCRDEDEAREIAETIADEYGDEVDGDD